jgi:hypothetical protein
VNARFGVVSGPSLEAIGESIRVRLRAPQGWMLGEVWIGRAPSASSRSRWAGATLVSARSDREGVCSWTIWSCAGEPQHPDIAARDTHIAAGMLITQCR